MAVKTTKKVKLVAVNLMAVVLMSSCFTPTRHDRHTRDDYNNYDDETYYDNSSDDYETLRDRSRNNQSRNNETTRSHRRSHGATTVPLTKEDGVYYLTVKINDVPMKFIYDTGASIISLSATEAMFLIKQGTITEDDLIGTELVYDAQGDATESLMVRLKKVEIGDLVLENVEASIVDNQVAPLLLGQSALSQFNRVSIDYQNNLLIIE